MEARTVLCLQQGCLTLQPRVGLPRMKPLARQLQDG